MIAETALLASIAVLLALIAFLAKELEMENETAFKALNLLAAIMLAIAFYIESANIAAIIATAWAITAAIFLFRAPTREAVLRGWDEDISPHSNLIKKKKRTHATTPKEKKPSDNTGNGTTPVWPWS